MNLPNLISLARLVVVPLIVWLMVEDEWRLAFGLFCLAGISDAADGFIAKRFDMQSLLGRFLDPMADKALLVAIFVALGIQGHLPVSLVILVVSRDVLIVAAVLLLYALGLPYEPRPVIASKINTAAQITLAAIVMADLAFDWRWLTLLEQGLIVITALTTVVSGAAYLIDWGRRMNQAEQGPK